MSAPSPEKASGSRAGSGAAADLRLSGYTRPEAILDLAVDSKDDLLRRLASVVLPAASDQDVDRILSGIQEREASVNTYVGSGVAIPHARVDFVDGIHLAVARNPDGFPYDIDTDEPVTLVILVVGDESRQSEHVHLLGAIASVLVEKGLRDQILHASDAAAVIRLLDSRATGRPRRKARPLTQLLLSHTRRIAREMGVTTILVHLESVEELRILRRMPRRTCFVVATSSQAIAEKAETVVGRVLLLPRVAVSQNAGVRLIALMALTHGLIRRGDVVAFLSGWDGGGLDSMTILEVGRQFGRFATTAGIVASGIAPEVLERVITLATELSSEGREGRPVGALFVLVGHRSRIRPYTQQMVINPFRGYREEERNILDPTLAETIKEFAAIDGAFVVRGDGVVLSGGTYLKVEQEADLPGGYGARHRAACALTRAVNCIAVVLSQSTGEVTIFKGGATILTLPKTRTT